MTFNPEELEQVANKKLGDQIRSSDWNVVVNQVQELGETKVDRSGDTITGPLTVEGDSGALLSVGQTENSAALTILPNGRVGIGTTTPRDTLAIRAQGTRQSLISFEDPDGTTRWHLEQNLGGNRPGLNFVETGVADGRLFIAARGNVGIGTTQPNATLEINESSSSGGVLVSDPIVMINARRRNIGSQSQQPIYRFMEFRVNNNRLGGGIDGVGEFSDTSVLQSLTFRTRSSDYAEYLPRLQEEEVIEAGDVVGVFGGKVSKLTQDAHRIMTITDRPIVLGNMPEEEQEHLYEQVSFIGQVPIKVSGAVQAGDYIIPSGQYDGTGIAVSPDQMTPDQCTQIVGQAWEGSDDPDVKRINAAVGLDWSSVVASCCMSEIAALRAEMQALKQERSIAHV